MWGELREVLIAFAGALIALWAVITVIGFWSRLASSGERKPEPSPSDRDRHIPISRPGEQGERRDISPDPAVTGPPCVHKIFVAPEASAPMRQVHEAEAEAWRGLRGDRYAEGCGFWSEKDECDVTLIAQEDLDEIVAETGLRLQNGEHRRNIVTRNIPMRDLAGRRFQIGDAHFAFDRVRPPCLHLQTITEPGMAHALVKGPGICVRCYRSGAIRQGDLIAVLDTSYARLLRTLLQRARCALRSRD
ncbi:MAG: MOSC domain-containing protein [Methyloligellaceae bacterium]